MCGKLLTPQKKQNAEEEEGIGVPYHITFKGLLPNTPNKAQPSQQAWPLKAPPPCNRAKLETKLSRPGPLGGHIQTAEGPCELYSEAQASLGYIEFQVRPV